MGLAPYPAFPDRMEGLASPRPELDGRYYFEEDIHLLCDFGSEFLTGNICRWLPPIQRSDLE